MPFSFKQLSIPGVVLVEPRVFSDNRGFFLELYKHSSFSSAIPVQFMQLNHSQSTRHVLRGLHYQKQPAAQGKLVTVIRGEVFDVAVDIRHGSPTYKQWLGVNLSAANHHMLYIPPGFAHGFCALSDVVDVMYYTSAEYSPEHDRGIRWNDPVIGVQWPVESPVISAKDAELPLLQNADNNFTFSQIVPK
ncbi:MAG: dTDP-4-dehydrorhamnose 3,5-epimerase [Anaerolineae bacterium]|nr:dTDP-4-dehydrorhamnose 3,5-epimerase [Anaerolineae bacterium]